MKYYAFALASLLLASCAGGAEKSNNGDNAASSSAVSAVKSDTPAEKTSAPVEQKSVQTLNDKVRIAHEVMGPVRIVTSDAGYGRVSKFNEKGELVYRMDASTSRCQTVVQEDGSLYMAFGGTVLYYTESGKLDSIVGGEEGSYFSEVFQYGPDGNVNKIIYTEGNEEEGEHLRKAYDVKVLETDAHGNWIRRMEGDFVVVREISYYGEPDNVCPFKPESFKYRFCGKISTMEVNTFEFGGKEDGQCLLNESPRTLKFVSFDKNSGKLTLSASVNGKVVGNYEGVVKISDDGFFYKGDFKNVNGASVPFDLSNNCF